MVEGVGGVGGPITAVMWMKVVIERERAMPTNCFGGFWLGTGVNGGWGMGYGGRTWSEGSGV